jgi:hypothetical protein
MHFILMICISVSIVYLQAAERLNSVIDALSTQTKINNETSNDYVSNKQLWQSIPNELILRIIDIGYSEYYRYLVACRLRLVNKNFYFIIESYFNTHFKQVSVYDYLKEQNAYFLNNYNLYRSFTEKSISQESIVLITKFPGLYVKTTIHFCLALKDSKLWHLIFHTEKPIIHAPQEKKTILIGYQQPYALSITLKNLKN